MRAWHIPEQLAQRFADREGLKSHFLDLDLGTTTAREVLEGPLQLTCGNRVSSGGMTGGSGGVLLMEDFGPAEHWMRDVTEFVIAAKVALEDCIFEVNCIDDDDLDQADDSDRPAVGP